MEALIRMKSFSIAIDELQPNLTAYINVLKPTLQNVYLYTGVFHRLAKAPGILVRGL